MTNRNERDGQLTLLQEFSSGHRTKLCQSSQDGNGFTHTMVLTTFQAACQRQPQTSVHYLRQYHTDLYRIGIPIFPENTLPLHCTRSTKITELTSPFQPNHHCMYCMFPFPFPFPFHGMCSGKDRTCHISETLT